MGKMERAETEREKRKKKEIHQRGGNEAYPILKSHIRKQRYGDCGGVAERRDGDES